MVGLSDFDELLHQVREVVFKSQFYPTPESILDFLESSSYEDKVKHLHNAVMLSLSKSKEDWALESLFACGLLLGLIEKFKLLEDDSLPMIDVCWSRVESAFPHKKLVLCNVDCGVMGTRYYGEPGIKVVTNDLQVKAGFRLPISFLPPREFAGVFSQGMFVETKNRKDYTGLPGIRAVITKDKSGGVLAEVQPWLTNSPSA